MTRPAGDLEQLLAELRRAFDDSFARPVPVRDRDWIDFLIIVVGGQPHAVRIADLAGLEFNRKIIPLPIGAPGLLGLAAVGGEPVPVFDLAVVLGAKAEKTPGQCLALHRDTETVALAFDGLRETRRVPLRGVIPSSSGAGQGAAGREAVSVQDGVAHVIDVPSVVALIRRTMHRR
jgi:chemotaxis signal transduction protein